MPFVLLALLISIDFWVLLIGFTALQGLLLALYIGLSKPDRAGRLLSILLLIISLMLIWFVFYYTRFYEYYPALIWFDALFYFTPGGIFYLFVLHRLYPGRGWRWYDALHLVPVLLMVWRLIPFWELGTVGMLETFRQFYSATHYDIDWIQMAMFGLISAYAVRAYFLHRTYLRQAQQMRSNSTLSDTSYIAVIAILFLIWAVLSETFAAVLLINFSLFIEVDFVSLLVLAAMMHYLGFEGFRRKDNWLSPQPLLPRPNGHGLSVTQLAALVSAAQAKMSSARLYLQPDLKITDLAEALQVPTHHLSSALNQAGGQHFFDFVNDYRVREVQDQLRAGAYKQVTMAALAADAGFNSETSFYRIFKKHTGMTPKQFVQSL